MSPLTPKISNIVFQPTSLCNLNCRYCYVPGRQDATIMPPEVLEKSIKLCLESSLIQDEVEFLWHAGEPLTVGLKFYMNAMDLIKKYNKNNIKISNVIQTNGVLINENWCHFFKENNFRIGVSIDGPEFLHNYNRKNWAGEGSYKKSISGYHTLKKNNVTSGVLTVLTSQHFSYPDLMYNFYVENQINSVGFNVEEIENVHKNSSFGKLSSPSFEKACKDYTFFMSAIFDLWVKNPKIINIREITDTIKTIRNFSKNPNFQKIRDEGPDLSTITIQKNGDITAYSPEFVGAISTKFNNFILDNILKLTTLNQLCTNKNFLKIKNSIDIGKTNCSISCKYFNLCGSSYISSRYFETNSFEATESTTCILQKKVLIPLIVEKIKGFNNSSFLKT